MISLFRRKCSIRGGGEQYRELKSICGCLSSFLSHEYNRGRLESDFESTPWYLIARRITTAKELLKLFNQHSFNQIKAFLKINKIYLIFSYSLIKGANSQQSSVILSISNKTSATEALQSHSSWGLGLGEHYNLKTPTPTHTSITECPCALCSLHPDGNRPQETQGHELNKNNNYLSWSLSVLNTLYTTDYNLTWPCCFMFGRRKTTNQLWTLIENATLWRHYNNLVMGWSVPSICYFKMLSITKCQPGCMQSLQTPKATVWISDWASPERGGTILQVVEVIWKIELYVNLFLY